MKFGLNNQQGNFSLLQCYHSLPSQHGEAALLFKEAAVLLDPNFVTDENSQVQQPSHLTQHLYETSPKNAGR